MGGQQAQIQQRREEAIDPVVLNNIFNFVQTIILAWIAAHPGRYYGGQGSGRMQRNGGNTD